MAATLPPVTTRYRVEVDQDGAAPHASAATADIYLEVTREDRCPHCGGWTAGESLCGIGFMDGDTEAGYLGVYRLDQLQGYLRDVAQGLAPAAKGEV